MLKFDFAKDILLEDQKVRLTPLEVWHFEQLSRIANDNDIWTFFLENGQGEEELKKYIQAAILNRREGKEYPLLIFDKKHNQCVGLTRLYEWNPNLCTIKVGHTWLGKKYQGTSINKRCKYLLFEFIFQ